MTIIQQDKDIEFEKDLVNLLIEHGYIPEEKRRLVKKVNLSVFADKPMTIEVHEEDEAD